MKFLQFGKEFYTTYTDKEVYQIYPLWFISIKDKLFLKYIYNFLWIGKGINKTFTDTEVF